MKAFLSKYLKLISQASLLIILATLLWFGGKWFWIEAWFVVEIFVLTFLTKTVPFRISLSAFSRGIYMAVGLSLLVYTLVIGIGFEKDSIFTSGILIPPLEELAKFLPVLLITYLLYRRQKKFLNPSDYLWISMLSGAGFSMIEKMYFGDVTFSYTYGPHLGGIYFFPDALSANGVGYIGHSAATGLIGMCFGLGIYIKQSQKAERFGDHNISVLRQQNSIIKQLAKFWWILPLAGFAWIVIEHAIVNISFIENYDTLYILKGGAITPTLFMILLVPTLGITFYGMYKSIKKHPVIKKAFVGESKKTIKEFKDGKWADGLILLKKTILMLRKFNIFVWQQITKN